MKKVEAEEMRINTEKLREAKADARKRELVARSCARVGRKDVAGEARRGGGRDVTFITWLGEKPKMMNDYWRLREATATTQREGAVLCGGREAATGGF